VTPTAKPGAGRGDLEAVPSAAAAPTTLAPKTTPSAIKPVATKAASTAPARAPARPKAETSATTEQNLALVQAAALQFTTVHRCRSVFGEAVYKGARIEFERVAAEVAVDPREALEVVATYERSLNAAGKKETDRVRCEAVLVETRRQLQAARAEIERR
jgi:hypothetical protein